MTSNVPNRVWFVKNKFDYLFYICLTKTFFIKLTTKMVYVCEVK